MKKYLLLGIACSFLAVSCDPDRRLVNATVIDTGNITGDGCGYLFVLPDSAYLKPTYLDAAYQHNGLKVKIQYTFSGELDTCEFGSKVYEMVTVKKIKKD
ncbi:MAG TPA: hypothetical protein PKX92_09100 [Edaphocola sp.]|nr:hypothetical protein [Edaphocola sp.]